MKEEIYIIVYNAESDFIIAHTQKDIERLIEELIEENNDISDITLYKAVKVDFDVKQVATVTINKKES